MAQPMRNRLGSPVTPTSFQTRNTMPAKPTSRPKITAGVSFSRAASAPISAMSSGWVPMIRLPVPALMRSKPKAEPRL